MEPLATDDRPIAHAYQARQSMPAVGIRASDWVLYRPNANAAPGELILGKYDGSVSIGRLLRGDDGTLVFYDGATGELGSLRHPHELRVFGVVFAVRGENLFH